ncbi:MAG: response regulator [Proteobacteria bacterium]|nr:response regulator [Pseudomonadota bacterium]
MAVRILLAEDDRHIVETLTFVLERDGFGVSAAFDGEDAVRQLRSSPPDLLILDVMLPRLNGFEVLKLVRSDPLLKSMPVIVLTAKGQAQDRRMAEEIGVDEFMTKPFSNRDIVAAVRRVTGPR